MLGVSRNNQSRFPRSLTVSSKSKLHKVKQDFNISSTHNALSEKDNQGIKRVTLEKTIRKIIQIKFENCLLFII